MALPLSLLGVLLISGVVEQGAYGHDPLRGTLFGLGAGVAYVGFLLLLRRGGADLRRPAGPLFDATAVATVLCLAAGLVIGDADLAPDWPAAGWLITLALSSQVIGWLLIGTSLPRLPAALTSILLTVQPVGSVVLAAFIFSESPSPIQLLGVALIMVALVAVARSSAAARVAEAGTVPADDGPAVVDGATSARPSGGAGIAPAGAPGDSRESNELVGP
jgi:drug/metabolite transporter (DMT)-like permease